MNQLEVNLQKNTHLDVARFLKRDHYESLRMKDDKSIINFIQKSSVKKLEEIANLLLKSNRFYGVMNEKDEIIKESEIGFYWKIIPIDNAENFQRNLFWGSFILLQKKEENGSFKAINASFYAPMLDIFIYAKTDHGVVFMENMNITFLNRGKTKIGASNEIFGNKQLRSIGSDILHITYLCAGYFDYVVLKNTQLNRNLVELFISSSKGKFVVKNNLIICGSHASIFEYI